MLALNSIAHRLPMVDQKEEYAMQLSAAADASHNDNVDSTTTIGYLLFIAGCLIVAKTIKLKHVTLSTNESELCAQTECGREVVAKRALLHELGFKQNKPTLMDCDSAGACAISERRAPTHRTKHIRLRDRWIVQLVSSGEALLRFVQGHNQRADGLTKPLTGELFQRFKNWLLSTPDD